MRWIHYSLDETTRYGILEGDRIREVRGTPFGPSEETSQVHRLADVRIEVPFIPRTFYAAGFNYVAHIIEHGHAANIPKRPEIGYRAVNALVAHDQPVRMPADVTELEYEGELAVVIGKRAKHVGHDEAMACVLGYTIGNDISERTWQKLDRTFWRAKNSDTFKPMGPWIETAFDIDAAETVVRVNGETTSSFRTGAMLFGIPAYISAMTRYLTLYPGDVIWMGTDGGSPSVHAGDVVEVEITGLGTLRNPFVATANQAPLPPIPY